MSEECTLQFIIFYSECFCGVLMITISQVATVAKYNVKVLKCLVLILIIKLKVLSQNSYVPVDSVIYQILKILE